MNMHAPKHSNSQEMASDASSIKRYLYYRQTMAIFAEVFLAKQAESHIAGPDDLSWRTTAIDKERYQAILKDAAVGDIDLNDIVGMEESIADVPLPDKPNTRTRFIRVECKDPEDLFGSAVRKRAI